MEQLSPERHMAGNKTPDKARRGQKPRNQKADWEVVLSESIELSEIIARPDYRLGACR